MIATVLYTPHASMYLYQLAALSVLAIGFGPLVAWFCSAWKSLRFRRLLMAVLVAAMISFPIIARAATVPGYEGCDAWWLEWFWICV